MIDVEVINVEAINTVDLGGRSMIDVEVINAEAIDTVDLGGGRSMINIERIGSTVNFHFRVNR